MASASVSSNTIIQIISFYNIQTNQNSLRITVLGNGFFGKTSLIYRFLNYAWPQEHDPTIEDSYKSNLKIEDEDYEVNILDTSGENNYQNMIDKWISFGEGFLLIFGINSKESFTSIKDLYDVILKRKEGEKCPILLVGNMQDLEEERQVTYAEAKAQANTWGIEYIETSAKTNFNCKEAFEKIALNIIKSKSKDLRKGKSNCIII